MQCQLFLVHRAFRFASVTAIPHALKWSVTAFVILCIFGGAAMGCGVALEIKVRLDMHGARVKSGGSIGRADGRP